jgi:hypothetical protein
VKRRVRGGKSEERRFDEVLGGAETKEMNEYEHIDIDKKEQKRDSQGFCDPAGDGFSFLPGEGLPVKCSPKGDIDKTIRTNTTKIWRTKRNYLR